jgi:hypothetical protein
MAGCEQAIDDRGECLEDDLQRAARAHNSSAVHTRVAGLLTQSLRRCDRAVQSPNDHQQGARGESVKMDFNKDGIKDHSLIVTKVTSSEIYMTYHSNDHLNRPLSELQSLWAGDWFYSYRT